MACSSVTLKGGTALDPLDITELYDASKYHDWGIVDTADGMTYDIDCKIIIGDGGVTETHFDLRKAGDPVVWRFGTNVCGIELNLATDDRANLDDSTITTIGTTNSKGLIVVAGTETQITTAKDLTISTFDTLIDVAAAAVLTLIDPKFVLVANTSGAGLIKEKYTWSFVVLDGVTPINLCHIQVWDSGGGAPKTDENTDAQGEIADQVYEANHWTASTPTSKTPHTFRFYEYDYATLTPTMAVSSKLDYSQQMTADPFVVKSKVDAGNIAATCQP